MKNIFAAFAVAAIFASCTSSPKTGEQTTTTQQTNTLDTSGFAQFQEWKKQQELMEWNRMYQGVNDEIEPAVEPQRVAASERRVVRTYERAPARRTTTARRTSTRSSGGSGTVARSGQTTRQPAAKRGWSKAAQGAAIGGASGAVIGAVVSKKKVQGAVIGGVIGAGGGYMIGRSMDKKDGRY